MHIGVVWAPVGQTGEISTDSRAKLKHHRLGRAGDSPDRQSTDPTAPIGDARSARRGEQLDHVQQPGSSGSDLACEDLHGRSLLVGNVAGAWPSPTSGYRLFGAVIVAGPAPRADALANMLRACSMAYGIGGASACQKTIDVATVGSFPEPSSAPLAGAVGRRQIHPHTRRSCCRPGR